MPDVDTDYVKSDDVNQLTPNSTNPPMKLNELIKRYTQLRDTKAQMKKIFEARTQAVENEMSEIEVQLLRIMDDTGVESVRTEEGTAYKTTVSYANVADWEAVRRYVEAHGHWHVLQRAVNKKEIENILEETGEVVPGVNLRRQINVNVRRS